MNPSHSKSGKRHGPLSMALILALLLSLFLPAQAAEAPEPGTQALSPSDFTAAEAEQELTGVFITGVPEGARLCLGGRVIAPGDVLSAAQLQNLTLKTMSQDAQEVLVSYVPICGTTVEREAVLTVSLKGSKDLTPEVRDGSIQTYKNLPNSGRFDAKDPEGSELTFTVTRQPRRGTVTVQENGSFLFTPKKNKVGKDYFTYTATDAAGNVSEEATVTIEILKPTDSRLYSDIPQETAQFEALWMKNTGLFSGAQVADHSCFQPDASVSRGEFLAMVMKLLDIPMDEAAETSGFADEDAAPEWLLPYLRTAMRLGLISGTAQDTDAAEAPVFQPGAAITGAEAAVMLQNILRLSPAEEAETAALETGIPAWAQEAAAALSSAGIPVSAADEPLTRMEAAHLLYAVSCQAEHAPGLEVFQAQQG